MAMALYRVNREFNGNLFHKDITYQRIIYIPVSVQYNSCEIVK